MSMDPRIAGLIRYYLSLGWKSSLIQKAVRRSFNADLKSVCISNIAEGRDCSAKCMESCTVKDAELWSVPHFEL